MSSARIKITAILAVVAIFAAPLLAADDAKPAAPAAVRAKAVVIRKAAPAAAAAPAIAVEVKAEIIEPAPAKPVAGQPATKADGNKPAAKPVAPANLKGFGKNEEARKPAPQKAAVEAMARPIPVPNANVNEAQMKQMAQQYKQQLLPVLTGELAFIRMMCDLPKDKRQAVRAAGLKVVDEVATGMAEQQNRGRVLGAVRAGVPTKQQAINDPPKAIRMALDVALKEALPEDQLKTYLEEAEHRKNQRKAAAIHSVVARLDGMLCLTAEVRDKITATIAESWQEDWERWLQMHQYGDQYFPTVPDKLVSEHLNAEQRQVWTGLQKVSFGGWGNFGGGVAVADDGWWGEPLQGGAGVDGAIFIDGAIGF